MTLTPSDMGKAPGAVSRDGKLSPEALARQWAALHDAALAIAEIAGQPDVGLSPEMLAFPAIAARLTGWRRVMVEEGMADLVAILEPGLVALLTVHERGGDASAAAGALWREFEAGRSALVAMAGIGDLRH